MKYASRDNIRRLAGRIHEGMPGVSWEKAYILSEDIYIDMGLLLELKTYEDL